jgi:hypothetical protein
VSSGLAGVTKSPEHLRPSPSPKVNGQLAECDAHESRPGARGGGQALEFSVSVNAGDWMSAMTNLKTLVAAACAPALATSAFAQEAPPPKRVLQLDGATVQTDWVGCYNRKDYDRFETLRAREPETAGKFMLQMEMQELCKNIDAGSRIFSEAFDDWSNRQCVRLSGEF